MVKRFMEGMLCIALLAIPTAFANAAVIFSENMGTGTSATVAAHTFQNAGLTFAGSNNVVDTGFLSTGDYAGASGGSTVRVVGNNSFFQISGIDTTGFSGPFGLSFGYYANDDTDTLSVEFTDGNSAYSFSTLPVLPDTPGSDFNFFTINAIPFVSTTNLIITFQNAALGATGYRLDDITLTAVPEPSSMALSLLGLTTMGTVLGRRRKR